MMESEIAEYLEDLLLGTVGTDIFYSFMPDAPEECICITEYAGRPSDWTQDGKHTDKPGLQVVARSDDYDAAVAKLAAVRAVLDAVTNATIGTTFYLNIRASQSLIPMGWDRKLVKVSQNYMVEME